MPMPPTKIIKPRGDRAAQIEQEKDSIGRAVMLDEKIADFADGEIKGLQRVFGGFTPNLLSLLTLPICLGWGYGLAPIVAAVYKINPPKYWNGEAWPSPGVSGGYALIAAVIGFFVLGYGFKLLPGKGCGLQLWKGFLGVIFAIPFAFFGVMAEVQSATNYRIPQDVLPSSALPKGLGVLEMFLSLAVAVGTYTLFLAIFGWIMLRKRGV